MRRPLWLLVSLSACGTRGTLYTDALTPLPLVATQSRLTMVVPQTRRAVAIDPGTAVPRGIVISDGARFATAVPGSDQLAILTGTAKAPTLDVVDTVAGTRAVLPTPGFFDRIDVSPDGKFGLLTYDASAGPGPLVARNLNEVGLWPVAGQAVTRLELDTESLAPRSVVFGPAESNRQLVAVALEHGAAIFDALHPEVPPRRISTVPQGQTSEATIVQALFSTDAHWLFLRAHGLDDVIVVELGAQVTGQPPVASINFVSGGTGLVDIAQPPPGFEDFVLAAFAKSQDAWLLEAHGIVDDSKQLVLGVAPDAIVPLTGNDVLLWSTSGASATAWDVSDGRTGTAALGGNFGAPVVVPPMDKALFPVTSTAGAGPVLSTVTVVPQTNRLLLEQQAIQLLSVLSSAAVDPQGNRLFFTVNGKGDVVTLDLATLSLSEVALDTPAASLAFIPNGSWVASIGADPLGDVTVAPAGATDRSSALRYTDFALTGELNRPGDPP